LPVAGSQTEVALQMQSSHAKRHHLTFEGKTFEIVASDTSKGVGRKISRRSQRKKKKRKI